MNQEIFSKKGARVVVAMSGGVDSSIAAAWLKEQRYEVIGVTLQLHNQSENIANTFGTCCSLSDMADARKVAQQLDIPFYVANMEEKFNESVVDDFVHEYLVGRTPNPCVRCNQEVKFNTLMDWALDLGAEYLATGHYANIRFNPGTNHHELCKGLDEKKDQSYFLFPIKRKDLARTLFPLGGLTKTQVRNLARKMNLSVADKPESQEICFVQEGNYKDFIEKKTAPELFRSGHIADKQGKIYAAHSGLHQFTIGQRKGLGVTFREPVYVTHFDLKTNNVVIGREEDLYSKHCTVSHLNWIRDPLLQKAPTYRAKIRYRAKESPAKVQPLLDNRVEALFEIAQRAITPGQAIVFYDEDVVVGGGWIEEVLPT